MGKHTGKSSTHPHSGRWRVGGVGGEILVEPQGARKVCLPSQVAGPEMGEKSL